MKMWVSVLWRVAAYSALACAAFSFALFYLYSNPGRYVSGFTPGAFGLAFEPVRLITADGVELSGWHIPRKGAKRAVIACHGYPMDKGNILGMISFLSRDFELLLFDFRAMGESGGFFSSGGVKESADLDAAAAFMKSRGFDKVGVFGFSMGASAALMSENPAIAARVADSPFSDLGRTLEHAFSGLGFLKVPMIRMMKVWSRLILGADMDRVSPLRRITALKAPTLIIHGDADTQVPVASALELKAACPEAELWIIKGADHGGSSGFAGRTYEKRITDFFNAHIPVRP